MGLLEFSPPFSAILPCTRYFEITSEYVGSCFAVWVTTPATYTVNADHYFPVVYVLDGNVTVPQTAVFHLLEFDPIYPIQPFVHVGVGYVGEDARLQLAVRARDLIPPGEPSPPGADESTMRRLIDKGMLDQIGLEIYLRNLRNPCADRFLAFLTDELHPHLTRLFKIETQTAGLFGYSYGGLFSTYLSLCHSPLFYRIGAGSPVILPHISTIFRLYKAELAAQTDYSDRMLHITVCKSELNIDSYYRNLVGQGTAEFISLARQKPLRGLNFSNRIIEHESHASALVPSWFSFIRACYSADHQNRKVL